HLRACGRGARRLGPASGAPKAASCPRRCRKTPRLAPRSWGIRGAEALEAAELAGLAAGGGRRRGGGGRWARAGGRGGGREARGGGQGQFRKLRELQRGQRRRLRGRGAIRFLRRGGRWVCPRLRALGAGRPVGSRALGNRGCGLVHLSGLPRQGDRRLVSRGRV